MRFVILALALMATTYAVFYFPYPAGSFPVRLLNWYLRTIASASAIGARLFDPTASASGDIVGGRFSLRIVLDCGALDAQALFAATVAAFPVPWRRRLVGVIAGSALIATFNIGRIVSLYAIGLFWPSAFHAAHEEVFQFGIIAVAFGAFWIWTVWARGPAGSGPAASDRPLPEAR